MVPSSGEIGEHTLSLAAAGSVDEHYGLMEAACRLQHSIPAPQRPRRSRQGAGEWPVVVIRPVPRRGIVRVRMATPAIDHLELSAIHEAAHAVVKWRLVSDFDYRVEDGGAGFHRIVVRSEVETASKPYIDAQGRAHHCSGIFEAPSFHTGLGALCESDPDFAIDAARRRMRHDIMVTFAGPLAEARVRGCPVEALFEHPKAGSTDRQLIEQTVRRMNLPADQHDSLLATLRAKTEGLSRRPPGVANDRRPGEGAAGAKRRSTDRGGRAVDLAGRMARARCGATRRGMIVPLARAPGPTSD